MNRGTKSSSAAYTGGSGLLHLRRVVASHGSGIPHATIAASLVADSDNWSMRRSRWALRQERRWSVFQFVRHLSLPAVAARSSRCVTCLSRAVSSRRNHVARWRVSARWSNRIQTQAESTLRSTELGHVWQAASVWNEPADAVPLFRLIGMPSAMRTKHGSSNASRSLSDPNEVGGREP